MTDFKAYYEKAKEVAAQLKWLPQTIFTQWAVETDHFTSHVFLADNNIAGLTWYNGCGFPKGTARPSSEGGFYIKYANPYTGYVDFVKKNMKRYGNVSKYTTPQNQFLAIAHDGWAANPHYYDILMSVYKHYLDLGIFKEEHTNTCACVCCQKKAATHPEHWMSLVDFLKAKKLPSDFTSRRILAEKRGINHYTGTAAENTKLLGMLVDEYA